MNLYKNIFELFTIKRIIHEQKRLFLHHDKNNRKNSWQDYSVISVYSDYTILTCLYTITKA